MSGDHESWENWEFNGAKLQKEAIKMLSKKKYKYLIHFLDKLPLTIEREEASIDDFARELNDLSQKGYWFFTSGDFLINIKNIIRIDSMEIR